MASRFVGRRHTISRLLVERSAKNRELSACTSRRASPQGPASVLSHVPPLGDASAANTEQRRESGKHCRTPAAEEAKRRRQTRLQTRVQHHVRSAGVGQRSRYHNMSCTHARTHQLSFCAWSVGVQRVPQDERRQLGPLRSIFDTVGSHLAHLASTCRASFTRCVATHARTNPIRMSATSVTNKQHHLSTQGQVCRNSLQARSCSENSSQASTYVNRHCGGECDACEGLCLRGGTALTSVAELRRFRPCISDIPIVRCKWSV